MANRKITQFPAISGNQVVADDIFTLVAVNEVNPSLKNKKITSASMVSGWLDQFFITQGGTKTFDSLTVTTLTVSGQTTLNDLMVTGTNIVFSNGITVTGDIISEGNNRIVGNLISFQTATGNEIDVNDLEVNTTGLFEGPAVFLAGIHTTTITGTDFFGGDFEGDNAQFTTITGTTANIVNISGTSITGNTVEGTSGTFQFLSGTTCDFVDVTVHGNIEFESTVTIDEDVEISGNLLVDGNITSSGTISGVSGVFTTITAETGIFTSFLSGQTISGTTIDIISGATLSGDRLATFKEAENQAIIYAIALG